MALKDKCEIQVTAKFAMNLANSNYSDSYERGYQGRSTKAMLENHAFNLGRSVGRQGLGQVTPAKFRICDNFQFLSSKYQNARAEGLQEFCSIDGIAEKAYQQGSRGHNRNIDMNAYRVCPEDLSFLQRQYEDSYRKGLRQFCSSSPVEDLAFEQGSQNQNCQLARILDMQCLQPRYSIGLEEPTKKDSAVIAILKSITIWSNAMLERVRDQVTIRRFMGVVSQNSLE